MLAAELESLLQNIALSRCRIVPNQQLCPPEKRSSLSLRRGGISAALKNWFVFVLARLLSSLGLLPPSAKFLGILQLFSIMGACNLCSLLLFHTMCRPVPLWSDGWLFPKVRMYFCFHGCDIFSPKLFSATLRFRALCRSFMAISVMHLTNWETKLWMFLIGSWFFFGPLKSRGECGSRNKQI